MLSCYFEAFSGKFTEYASFNQKSDSLRRKLRNIQKVCFSQQVSKRANPEENFDLFNIFFNKPVKVDKC